MSLWVKDPADVAWYQFDWSGLLDTGETITSYTISCDANLTKTSDAQTGSFVNIKVSGGIAGAKSLITTTIDTSNANHYEAEKYIYISERFITP